MIKAFELNAHGEADMAYGFCSEACRATYIEVHTGLKFVTEDSPSNDFIEGHVCDHCGTELPDLREDDEDKCRTCGAVYADGGDGFDGECPSCADRTDAALDPREKGDDDGREYGDPRDHRERPRMTPRKKRLVAITCLRCGLRLVGDYRYSDGMVYSSLHPEGTAEPMEGYCCRCATEPIAALAVGPVEAAR